MISCASSSSASASVRVVTIVIDRVCETIRCSRFGSLRDLRVIAHPVLQRPRLADVEHVAARILHPVDPRARGSVFSTSRIAATPASRSGSVRAAHGIGRLILVEAIGGAGMVGTVGLAHAIDLGTLQPPFESEHAAVASHEHLLG